LETEEIARRARTGIRECDIAPKEKVPRHYAVVEGLRCCVLPVEEYKGAKACPAPFLVSYRIGKRRECVRVPGVKT